MSLATLKRWFKRCASRRAWLPPKEARHKAEDWVHAEERRALWRRQLEENPEATLKGHRRLWERGHGVRVGCHDEPGDLPARVDLQAKTVAAS
jgi:hypothetical protein